MNRLLNLKNFTLAILYILFAFTLFGRWGVGLGALVALLSLYGMEPVSTLETISRGEAMALLTYSFFIFLWTVNGFYPGGLIESQIKHIEKNGLWKSKSKKGGSR